MMGIEHDDELLESMLVQSQTAPFKNFQRDPKPHYLLNYYTEYA